jgi:hypothetical protein
MSQRVRFAPLFIPIIIGTVSIYFDYVLDTIFARGRPARTNLSGWQKSLKLKICFGKQMVFILGVI